MAGNWQGTLLLVLLGAVIYLIYRVDQLEKAMTGRARARRTVVRTPGNGKVIPILKPDIEPGPFAKGNARKDSDREDEN